MNTRLKTTKNNLLHFTNHHPIRNNVKRLGLSSFIIALTLALPSSLVAAEGKGEQGPYLHVRQIGYGHLVARSLHVASYYKLFDLLQEGPKKAEEIVSGTNLNGPMVKRLLRVLANHDVVTMDDSERFSLNQNSQLLISTTPNSLQPALAKEFESTRWQAIGNIHLAMTENVIPYDRLFGMSFYAYLERNEEASKLFNAGMKNFSEQEDEQVSKTYPFKDFKSFCDVGGGTGGLVSRILEHHSGVQGILFDLPEAIKECTLPTITKVGGNFFESLPPAEVYTVKRVLHNWENKECVTILKNTARALSDKNKGRILVIEKVLPAHVDGTFLIDSDIIGMAMGGRERTLGEFITIGKEAGLELVEQTVLPSGVSILIFKTLS